MKSFELHNLNTKSFVITVCIVIIVLLSTNDIKACSWDYPIWQIRSKNADPLYRFIKAGKAGFINQKGEIVINPTLRYYGNYGDEFLDGLLLTGVGDGEYIDKSGQVVLKTEYYRNWGFSDGLAAAMEEDEGNWGYIDKTGKFVISPRFESYPNGYVYSFSDGAAKIKVRNKYGYIDRTGKFIIKPIFLEGTDFKEGLATVVTDGPCSYSHKGDDPCLGSKIVGGKIKWEEASTCKVTFINKNGTKVFDEKFDDALGFSEGLAAIRKGSKWGFINDQGTIIIEPKFDDVKSFSEGLAAIKRGKIWGFINQQGEIVIEPKFDTVSNFSDGLASIGTWNENQFEFTDYYFINKQGKQAFDGKFEIASHYFKGLAHVKFANPNTNEYKYFMNGKYAYIDVNGNKVFSYKIEKSED